MRTFQKTTDIAVIREQFVEAKKLIGSLEVAESFTIADYPIGARDRGQCKMEYEMKPKAGEYRTVRTTTDKHGRWCTPKKSTYRNFMATGILTGAHLPKPGAQAAWLHIGRSEGTYLTYANFDNLVLIHGMYQPRREDESVTYLIGGVPQTPSVYKADPPEMIAAYDEYIMCMTDLVSYAADRGLATLMSPDVLAAAMMKHIKRFHPLHATQMASR